jgi:hypothetical protein
VESLSAPLVQYQSNPIVGFATQTISEAIKGQAFVSSSSTHAGPISVEEESAQVKPAPKNTNPMRGMLRFLIQVQQRKGILFFQHLWLLQMMK